MFSGDMVSNMHDCGRGGRGEGLKLIGIIIDVVGRASSTGHDQRRKRKKRKEESCREAQL